jgi:hypothetical protein
MRIERDKCFSVRMFDLNIFITEFPRNGFFLTLTNASEACIFLSVFLRYSSVVFPDLSTERSLFEERALSHLLGDEPVDVLPHVSRH